MTLLNPKAVKQSWLQRVLGIPPTVLENCLEMCQRHFKYTPQPNEALYPNKVHYPLAPWEGDCDDFAATLASVLGKATNAPTYFHYCYAPSGVFHVGVSCKTIEEICGSWIASSTSQP